MVPALLLIAHGSREPEANADLHHIAETLRRRGGYACVEAAFLELAPPNCEEAAARCVAHGAECVILVPYFLSAGVHVNRDLSAVRQRLADRYPRVRFKLAEPLGRHHGLIEIVLERAQAAAGSEIKK